MANGIIACIDYYSGYKQIKIVKEEQFYHLEHYEVKLDKEDNTIMVQKMENNKSFASRTAMMAYLAMECIEEM